jgi:ABC-type branched-subunit amino acid transport system ATPase component
MSILEADSIGVWFGTRRVLSAASIRVEAGRTVALLGRNGSGKTTLLNVINGFVRPAHGHVTFDGVLYERPRLKDLAEAGLFYIPERDLLSRGRPLGDHIELLLRRHPGAHAAEVVRRMRLGPCLNRPPERLSGGERRRAEFGLALMRRPTCLLADEPFMGIAPRDAEEIGEIIREIAADGCAILITGHEVQSIFSVAHEINWVTSGTVYPLGSPAEASRHDPFRRAYLGPRATQRAQPGVRSAAGSGTAAPQRGT